MGFRGKRIGSVDPHSDLSRLARRSRNGTDRISVSSFHARARLFTPKNRGPDQCVPVIRSAITVSDRYRWPSYSNPSSRTRTVWVCPRHCRTKVAPVFSAPPGSKEGAPFSNSPAKIRKRRCKARVGLPWARCCSLSARPLMIYSRCGLHTRTVTVCRDRYPKASDTSSPPCLLRSLPAGAVAGWGLHPLEKRRLVTAHVESGHPGRYKNQDFATKGRSAR